LKSQLESEGGRVDHWQLLSLVHSARDAKERLLTDTTLEEVPISVASRGASLFAKTLSTRLTRDAVLEGVLHGFFPLTEASEMPATRRSAGLQEYGLPFVSDPAMSRHLARFLRRSLENVQSDPHLLELVGPAAVGGGRGFIAPHAVLFNGGVFNAAPLRERVVELLNRWAGDRPVRELPGSQYDLAVAKGAAYYARTLAEGKGIRIKAGTARSYYLGLEPSMPAVPGFEPPIKGLCVVPQGIEEGSELRLPGEELGLVTGEQVEFRFFSSAVRAGDTVGVIVEDAAGELEETSRLQVTLPPVDGKAGEIVPVTLDAVVTEVGTLELWMKHTLSEKRWKLEFNVRPSR
jgi:urease beta subunit